jgi:DNA repair and recombination protein RAD54B
MFGFLTLTLSCTEGMPGHRIGRKDWDGLPLQSGYCFYVGNKEISLDSPISSSKLPSITGVEEETKDPADVNWDRSPPTSPVVLQQKHLSKKENIHQAQVSKSFVPPTSFYGQLPKKRLNDPL